MAAEIYIISGFLGAGKTTLIRKLLKEAFADGKVVLIENDFGDVSVDAALLRSGGVQVTEIRSGCICCSLSGDFIKALRELLDRFRPDRVVIEPSGVGKLSDIAKACSDPRIRPLADVKAKITVVDVKRCKMYLDNFGEFFEDQIENADVVLLSRAEAYPDQVDAARLLVRGLNGHAEILAKPWDRLRAAELFRLRQPHGHGGHAHDCEHHHSAEEAFDTVTIRTKRIFGVEDLKARVTDMERNAKGLVLRAKGIVRGPAGYIQLQYLPGDIRITACDTGGDMLCIIGRDLNRQELSCLFGGE